MAFVAFVVDLGQASIQPLAKLAKLAAAIGHDEDKHQERGFHGFCQTPVFSFEPELA